jgi:hypothetical protein
VITEGNAFHATCPSGRVKAPRGSSGDVDASTTSVRSSSVRGLFFSTPTDRKRKSLRSTVRQFCCKTIDARSVAAAVASADKPAEQGGAPRNAKH